MKKILVLFAITIYLFACNAGDESKTTTAADSTITDTTKKSAILYDSAKRWEISADIATKMKNHLKNCKNDCTESNIIDSNKAVLDSIKLAYPGATITWVPARYQEDDENRYCTLRNFEGSPKKCKVKNCRTSIVQVTINTEGAATQVLAYDIVTICPPPYDAKCPTSVKQQ
ncbi:MAG: hypothetical protein JWN83_764 [Chitinophagaceae bacterium]|nr:hypothetical protein [Chitinophagaceae bacterium]